MQASILPDRIVKRIKLPIFGYNTPKFLSYVGVGGLLALIAFGVTRDMLVVTVIVAMAFFAGFAFSIVRVNGEMDLDTYILSVLFIRERALRKPDTKKLISVDGISSDGTMLKVGGSYIAVLEVTGDTVAVMSESKMTEYFNGFMDYLKQSSSKVVVSIVTFPSRYDVTGILNSLKPRSGRYYQELMDQYVEYLKGFSRGFTGVRAYKGMILLRINARSVIDGKDSRGVDVEGTVRMNLEFEIAKVMDNLVPRSITVRWIVGEELYRVGDILYNKGGG